MLEFWLAFCVAPDSESIICTLSTVTRAFLFTPFKIDLVQLRKEVLNSTPVGTTPGTMFGAIDSH